MRKRVVECDTCAKQHDLKQTLPPEWLVLRQYGNLVNTGNMTSTPVYSGSELITTFSEPELIFIGKEERHFCSDRCLAIWLQKRGNDSKEDSSVQRIDREVSE